MIKWHYSGSLECVVLAWIFELVIWSNFSRFTTFLTLLTFLLSVYYFIIIITVINLLLLLLRQFINSMRTLSCQWIYLILSINVVLFFFCSCTYIVSTCLCCFQIGLCVVKLTNTESNNKNNCHHDYHHNHNWIIRSFLTQLFYNIMCFFLTSGLPFHYYLQLALFFIEEII